MKLLNKHQTHNEKSRLTLTLEEIKQLYNDATYQTRFNHKMPIVHIKHADNGGLEIIQPPDFPSDDYYKHY